MSRINVKADRAALRHQRRADRDSERARMLVDDHARRDRLYKKVREKFPATGPDVVAATEAASSFGGQLDALRHLDRSISPTIDADDVIPAMIIGGAVFGVGLGSTIYVATGSVVALGLIGLVELLIVGAYLWARRRPYRDLRRAVKVAQTHRPLHPVEVGYLEKTVKGLEKDLEKTPEELDEASRLSRLMARTCHD